MEFTNSSKVSSHQDDLRAVMATMESKETLVKGGNRFAD